MGFRKQPRADALTSSLPALAIPVTLQDARRGWTALRGEGHSATGGRPGPDVCLRAVAGGGAPDELALERGLEQLVRAEVLYQRGILPQAAYLFKHALIQEAAYQSLLKSTRSSSISALPRC